MLPGLAPCPIDPPPASVTALSGASNGDNLTTYTFSSMALGTEAPDRKIVVGLTTNGSEGYDYVTVGGVFATRLTFRDKTAFWIVDLPNGTTASVVFRDKGECSRAGICMWAVYGLISGAPVQAWSYDSADGPIPGPAIIDGPQGGVILALARGNSNGSWSGVPQDFSAILESGSTQRRTGGARAISAFEPSISISYSGSPDALEVIALR